MKYMLTLGLIFFTNLSHALIFEAGVPDDVKAFVQSDLAAVDSITATQKSPLHAQIFGAVDGKVYTQWFHDRIDAFGYDPDMQGGAIAYNDSGAGTPNHMMVTDYFVKGHLPQVARVLVMFHEARHSEEPAGYWMHTNCPIPFKDDKGHDIKSIFSGLPLAGENACDTTTRGAYGTGGLMMVNIGRFCQNCSEKLKQDALIYGTDQGHRIINKSEYKKFFDDSEQVAP